MSTEKKNLWLNFTKLGGEISIFKCESRGESCFISRTIIFVLGSNTVGDNLCESFSKA